jgi:hypothetical protein
MSEGKARTVGSTLPDEWRREAWSGRLAPFAALADFVRGLGADFLAEPLNGQKRRKEAVREILDLVKCRLIIETGTFRGASARYFGDLGTCRVISIEANPRYHWFARYRVGFHPRVQLICGDSRRTLAALAVDDSLTNQPTLFYLDAHWGEDLPLSGELELIRRSWKSWVAVIDDFCVPGDPGYGYDDYGPGKTLELGYLDSLAIPDLRVFWPRYTSAEETGLRRGCAVVTTSPDVAELLATRAVTLIQNSSP